MFTIIHNQDRVFNVFTSESTPFVSSQLLLGHWLHFLDKFLELIFGAVG
jgi:hypothetical protein